MTRRHLLSALTVLAACSHSATLSPARFANAPPVELVDDRRDVPIPPDEHEAIRTLYFFDAIFYRPAVDGLALRRERRALGVNALDEVPDSTWFTHRIGKRDLTTEELIAGPTRVGSPEPFKPWTIISGKVTGEAPGYIVTDARGERFLLKFDRKENPEVETTAHVIVNRLLWASGYLVPEDFIVYVHPGELQVAPDATQRDPAGNDIPLARTDLDGALARLAIEPDGRIRGMASRILDGKTIGGTSDIGVRHDDPNDRIPHELRRDRRGARPIFAWLDHVDVKEANTLDMWIENPRDPRRHHVQHYLLDFGKSLGAQGLIEEEERSGYEHRVDLARLGQSLVQLGFAPRPWSGRKVPSLRGVGLFSATAYEPGAWKPYSPAPFALLDADRFDFFWGAKILIRFTPAQLRALVGSMRLSDPRAVDYLTTTLVARQRATARHAFAQVNPLEHFEVATGSTGTGLCFEDLWRTYRFGSPAERTLYETTSFDRRGRRLGLTRTVAAPPGSRACSAPLALAGDRDGYTIVRITTRRPALARSTLVHLARTPGTGAWRVIGILRE